MTAEQLTTGQWINGRAGVRRWKPDPVSKIDPVTLNLARDALVARQRTVIEGLVKQRDGLVRALSLALPAGQPTTHRGIICPTCGCWCKPHEQCPACLVNQLRKDGLLE